MSDNLHDIVDVMPQYVHREILDNKENVQLMDGD